MWGFVINSLLNMKKLIITLSLVVFLSPILVSAAWWNPFSWGKKPALVVEQVQIRTSVEDAYVPETTQEKSIDKVVERIVEKPIIKTQTITVQDPALQAKIDALVSENNDLKAQIARLLKLNASLASNTEESQTNTYDPRCKDAKKNVVDYNKEKVVAYDEYRAERSLIEQNPFASHEILSRVDTKYYSLENMIYAKISTAQAEVQLYCK